MKTQFLQFALLTIFIYSPFILQGQYNQTQEFLKGNNIWAFGEYGGLDLREDTVQPIETAIRGPFPVGVCAETGGQWGYSTVSHRNTGDLLFYTNGEVVWNADHQQMPNGFGLLGNTISLNPQGTVIVPFINDTSKYYIFSMLGMGKRQSVIVSGDTMQVSLFYSIVDMSLNNGLGDVVSGEKNVPLDTTIIAGMKAIPGCERIWILVHSSSYSEDYHQRRDTSMGLTHLSPIYKAYEITVSGVNGTPVISPGKLDFGGFIELQVSPDRSILAAGGYVKNMPEGWTGNQADWLKNGIELSRFDPNTGMVSQPMSVSKLIPNAGHSFASAIAFSPNGKHLYHSEPNVTDRRNNLELARYRIDQFDSAAIHNSRMVVRTQSDGISLGKPKYDYWFNLRTYKDAIYVLECQSYHFIPDSFFYVSKILSPDNSGNNIDYEQVALFMSIPPNFSLCRPSDFGSEVVYAIPEGITNTIDTLLCQGWDNGFTLKPRFMKVGYHYTWNDGTTDTLLTIDTPGTYWVRYSVDYACTPFIDTFVYRGAEVIPPVISVDSFVLVTAMSYATYQWIFNGQPIPGATDSTYTVNQNGFYQVEVSNAYGCKATSEIYEVTNATSIDEMMLPSAIHIYPNPASHQIYVQSPLPVAVSLWTLDGKCVQPKQRTEQLSIADLCPGMYFMKIEDLKGRLLTVEKIIKAH